MTAVVIFFIAGVLLIAAEVILPGGIIGLIGGLLLFGGVATAYSEFGVQGGFIAAAVALVLVLVALYFEFKILPKTKMGQRLFLKKSIQTSNQYSKGEDEMIGLKCETITALAPTGFVRLDGAKIEAASRSGFIEKNERVEVTGRDNFRIIVSKI
tara:strand:+ start:280 stop:744 length:465 start_codon:yes stop_codon:yes gene_type:complete